jgi:hypothetical protein
MVGMMQTAVNLLAVINDPGMPDLTREREVLMRFLDASIQSTSGTHGYPAEDIGYGTACSARLFIVASIAGRAGYYDVKSVCPPALNFGRAMLHFVQPWGEYLSNTGDHADDFGHREFVLPRLAAINNDPTVLWLMQTIFYPPYTRQWVGRNKEYPELKTADGRNIPISWRTLAVADDFASPVHPAQAKVPTQFMDNSRGLVSFRSGWEPDDTFVYFDGSHRPTISQGHEHDSAGHFALTAMGEYFGISPGRYNMDQTCHSVVLVDGKTGHDTDGEWRHTVYHGQLTSYTPHDFVDATSCDNSQQSNCYWSYRTLALVKGLGHGMPSYVWTLDDVNADHGKIMPRDYWWTLHTSPGNTITTAERSATITGCRHGNKLDVFFANPESADLPVPYKLSVEQDEAQPSAWRYIPKERIDAERENFKDAPWEQLHGPVFFRPRLVGRFNGPNGKFLTLMVPREKSAPAAVFKRLPGIDAQIGVTLRVGDVEDTIVCAYGHKILTAGDIDARGDWLVVRRELSTGRVLAHRLSGGSYLKVGGQQIV